MSYSAYSFLRDYPVLMAAFAVACLGLVVFTGRFGRGAPAASPPAMKRAVAQAVPAKADTVRAVPAKADTVQADSVQRLAKTPDDPEAPWVSDVLLNPGIICGYEPVSPPEDLRQRGATSAQNKNGRALGEECFFKQTRSMEAPPRRLTDIALTNGQFLLVSPALQAVLGESDLGQGAFYSTEILAADEVTRLPYHHGYWNIGNRKDTLQADETPGLDPVSRDPTSSMFGVFFKPKLLRDGMICLSRASLEGPDVWAEANMRGVLFFSASLVRRLEDAGFADAFQLSRCRLIEPA